MRLDTVWIRRDKDGVRRKVNAVDYASEMGRGKYAGWSIERESRGDKTDDMVSGKSLGISAKVPAAAVENAEQNAGTTERYKKEQKRRPGRPRKYPAADKT